MTRPLILGVVSTALLVLAVGCGPPQPEPVRVAAAASLADVLVEVAERHEGRVEFNFAGSNELARQILGGAPMDLFLSADRRQIDRLASQVDPSRAKPLLANRLVVIVPRDSPIEGSVAELLAQARVVAIADPEGVPAGVYARRWLEESGLWEGVSERVAPTLNVRAALAAVGSGAADLGVVYATDAATSDRVEVRFEVPAEETPWIRYWLLPLDERPETGAFASFLEGASATRTFRRHGFVPLASGEEGAS